MNPKDFFNSKDEPSNKLTRKDSKDSAISVISSSSQFHNKNKPTSSKFLNTFTYPDDEMNNSFSYRCPYEPSVQNSLNAYGFSGLNPSFCPHRPENHHRKNENIKKYAKRMKENLDLPKNTIHLDNVLKLKDKRTTIMIRHIPNKYTIDILMEEININFKGKYDVLYLPIDFVNNTNLGFAFINFIDPMHLIYFYDEFIDRKWKLFNSGKRCQLVYGKLQGKAELLEYAKKRNGMNGMNKNEYRYPWQMNCYVDNSMYGNPPQIEIPMKYYKVFLHYYQYALCQKKNDNVFIVVKYYNF